MIPKGAGWPGWMVLIFTTQTDARLVLFRTFRIPYEVQRMGSCMPVFGTASSDSAIGAQEDRMRVLNPVAADKKKDVQ